MAKSQLDIIFIKQARTKLPMYFTPNSPRIKMESFYSQQDNENTKIQGQLIEERGKDKMYERILKINNALSLTCSRKVVQLNGCSEQEKINNIELIEYLVLQVGRLQDANAKLNQYRRKSDQFLMDREELLQKICKDQRSIELQKSNLIAKKQNLQRSYKEMTEKFTVQRDQLQKQLRKIQARQKSYQAQFRKKDNQIKYLQESIKKIQEKSQPKNHIFEIIERPSYHKSKQKQISAISQYHQYSINRVEQTLRQLIQQNKQIREFFLRFIGELNKIFVNAKMKLNQVSYSDEEIQKENLIIIMPEIFNLPMKQNRQKVEQLFENLRILNQILVLSGKTIEKENKSEGKFQVGEWKIKSLIENYNDLITCQDQLINKMIPTTLDRPREYQQQEQERCNQALQNFEFDKIREMIDQQINQIESKNRFIGETKNKLIGDISRTEYIKKQMEKERSQLFELPF